MKVANYIFVTIAVPVLLCNACSRQLADAAISTASASKPNADSSVGASSFYIDNAETVVVLPPSSHAPSTASITLARIPYPAATISEDGNIVISTESVKVSLKKVNGTTVDRSHLLAMVFGFKDSRVSIVDLARKKEIAVYESNSILPRDIGGKSVQVNGIVLNPHESIMTVGTANGFDIVSYANPDHPVLVREIASTSDESPATANAEVSEHFAIDRQLVLANKTYNLTITGPSHSREADTSTLQLIDNESGIVYIPNKDTSRFLQYETCIDAIAIDTTLHIAMIAPQFSSEHLLIDLNKLALDEKNRMFNLPAEAVARVKMPGYQYTNIAIESGNHYVFIAKGSGSANYLVGKLNSPNDGLGVTFLNNSVLSMPLTKLSNGGQYSWEGAYEPHGINTYAISSSQTPESDHSVVLWTSADFQKIALINLSSTKSNRDIQYFSLAR